MSRPVRNPIYEMKVSFTDAMELMKCAVGEAPRLEQRKLQRYGNIECCELPPKHLVCRHGIFVDLDSANGIALTGKERQELEGCPSGDPWEPCLTFPCTLKELEEFVDHECAFDWINPFVMAEWVQGRLTTDPSEGQSQQPDHRSSERKELKAQQVLGLLAEALSQRHPNLYDNGGKPNVSMIVSIMLGVVEGYARPADPKVEPVKLYGFGKSTLENILKDAIESCEASLVEILQDATVAWDRKKSKQS